MNNLSDHPKYTFFTTARAKKGELVKCILHGLPRASYFKISAWLFLIFQACIVVHPVHAQQSGDSSESLNNTDSPRLFEPRSQGPDELVRRVYLGLGVGRSSLEPDTDALPGVTVSGGQQTATQATFQATAGMDVNKWFSVELHGANLGRAGLSDSTSIAYRDLGLSALVYVGGARQRMNRRGWTAFGRAGIGHLLDPRRDSERSNADKTHWLLGAGTEFSTRSGFALRAEGIAFDTEVSYLQLGLIYRIAGRSEASLVSESTVVLPKPVVEGEAALASGEGDSGDSDQVVMTVDDDGDGVMWPDDDCEDTPPGVAVGDNGCALFVREVEALTFNTDSAELTREAKEILEGVLGTLKQIPGAKARVVAHADSIGEADYNMQLSKHRAISVARYLVHGGIPKARLEARAFGELRPVDTNATPVGRRQNRRVEIDLIAE
ncbi:MAG: OmpA family protein [Granulosicoccus sp.]